MTDYYVSTLGDNGDDGLSEGNAKATIAGALAVPPSAGDTIFVKADGTYAEDVDVRS